MLRILTLDGLRGVAILFVILSHVAQNLEVNPATILLSLLGRLGVNLFFCISGFLITGILLKNSDLKRFYKRRIRRIFPAYYVFLLAMLLTPTPAADFFAAAVYAVNYFWSGDWHLAHTWSLAVEEQFYLVLPFTMVWLKDKFYLVLIASLLICPIIRLLYLKNFVELPYFEAVADSLAVGCLLAVFRERLHETRYLAFLNSKICYLLPVLAISLSLLLGFPKYYDKKVYVALIMPIQNILIALTLDWCILKEFRVLQFKPLVFIGLISYSLYLWQQPFLYPGWDVSIWLKAGLAFTFAVLSYYLIERPFLKL